jgi:hypothetical protein
MYDAFMCALLPNPMPIEIPVQIPDSRAWAPGRVNRDSIVVVSATHPAFVAAARQALLASLFRPAYVVGRAVRTRVRIPYEFAIRNGTGRAR